MEQAIISTLIYELYDGGGFKKTSNSKVASLEDTLYGTEVLYETNNLTDDLREEINIFVNNLFNTEKLYVPVKEYDYTDLKIIYQALKLLQILNSNNT